MAALKCWPRDALKDSSRSSAGAPKARPARSCESLKSSLERRPANSPHFASWGRIVRVHVGTCGFSYKDWIGPFYPHGMKSPGMLEFYAEHFDAVEIDSTYYAVPKPQLFTNMAARTPPDFRFTVKAPGSITHVPAAGEPPIDDVRLFREALTPLPAST